jgi:hypothetical protein
MADTKISALTALAAADVDTAADVLAIVDTGATTTKKIVVDDLRTAMGPKLATEQATTSGTSIDFTSVPSWAKKITVQFVGVSTSGTSDVIIQIGDSGGIEATGYLGAGGSTTNGSTPAVTNYTTGFGIGTPAASSVFHGAITLTLENSSSFTWVCTGLVASSNAANIRTVAGSKSLSAALDRFSITTASGSDTFDAGAINAIYE